MYATRASAPPGYSDLLDALADPKHENHADMVDWIGAFDAEVFDVDEVNKELTTLSAKRSKKSAVRRVK